MNLKIKVFVVVGLLIPVATAHKYTNESWKFIDDVYDEVAKVVNKYPTPILDVSQRMLSTFEVYTYKLKNFANCENSTILSDGAVMMLNYLRLFQCLRGSPENMLVEFAKVLPQITAGIRDIVSFQLDVIGELTHNINDDIECIVCALTHLYEEFLKNGLDNLGHGKKSDFGPVMWGLQKLTNTIALIAKTILNDTYLFNDQVVQSMTILSIVLDNCFTIVQGTKATLACLIYSKTNRVPRTLSSCLYSMDSALVSLTDSIDSVAINCDQTMRQLLQKVTELNDSLSEDLEKECGLTKGAILTTKRITQNLSSGFSKARVTTLDL